MTNQQRDRLLLMILKNQQKQEVWIKWIFGTVIVALTTPGSSDKISGEVRKELQAIEDEFTLMEEVATNPNPTVN